MINVNDALELNELADKLTDKIEFAENSQEIINVGEMRDEINYFKKILTYYIIEATEERNADFARGRLAGITQTFDIFISHTENLTSRAENTQIIISELKKLFRTSPKCAKIIDYLKSGEGIRHGELAGLLNIDTSTLTYHIKFLEKTGLVYIENIGKYKFYYLTKLGEDYKKAVEENADKERLKNLTDELKFANAKVRFYQNNRMAYLGEADNNIISVKNSEPEPRVYESIKSILKNTVSDCLQNIYKIKSC